MEPGFHCEKNSAQASKASAEAFFRSGFPAGMKAYFCVHLFTLTRLCLNKHFSSTCSK